MCNIGKKDNISTSCTLHELSTIFFSWRNAHWVEICQYNPILFSHNKNYNFVISKQKERERKENAENRKRKLLRRLSNIKAKTNKIIRVKTFRTNWWLAQIQLLSDKARVERPVLIPNSSLFPWFFVTSHSNVKSWKKVFNSNPVLYSSIASCTW